LNGGKTDQCRIKDGVCENPVRDFTKCPSEKGRAALAEVRRERG
jgi:hypothetical protein